MVDKRQSGPNGERANSGMFAFSRKCPSSPSASRHSQRFRPRVAACLFIARRQHRLHRHPGHWGPFPLGTLFLRLRSHLPLTPRLLPLPRTTRTQECSLEVPVPALRLELLLLPRPSCAPTYRFHRNPPLSWPRLQMGSSQASSITMTASVSLGVIVSPHSIFTSVQSVAYRHQ